MQLLFVEITFFFTIQTMNTEIMPTPGECEQSIPADLPSGPPSSKNYEVVAKITGAGNLPSQIFGASIGC